MAVVKNLMIRAGADFSELEKELKNAQKSLKNAGKELTNIGKSLTTSVTAPIVGAAAGLGKLALDAGKAADELITMSNKTGLSTQTLQELEYASRFVDVEVETMTDSMVKLTRTMDSARDGSKSTSDAYKQLGVQVTNSDGSLRDSKTVWLETITALGKVGNETERDALALTLFGKSAQELNPLIAAGGDALAQYAQEANDMGIIMSGENVSALGAFDDAMQKVQASLGGAKNEIAAALLPTLEQLLPVITEQIVPAVISFGTKIGEIITKFSNLSPEMQGFILKAIGIVAALGPVLLIFGTFMTSLSQIIGLGKTLSTVFTGIKAIFTIMTGPIGLVILAIGLLVAAGIALYQNWDTVKEKAGELWDGIKNAFNGVKDFMTDLWDSIVQKVKDGMNKVIDIINGLTSKLKVTVPSNIPIVGGMSLGVDIPKIPKLASGGIVTDPTVAMIGEAGPEAVIPIDQLLNAIRGNSSNKQNINLTIELDGKVIAKQTYDHLQTESRIRGVSLASVGGW